MKLFNMMHNQNMIHEGPVIYHNGCINKDITHETIVFYHDDLTELFQNKSLLEPFSQGLKKTGLIKVPKQTPFARAIGSVIGPN